ncbi:zinc metalloprotease HtpX [Aquibium sp. A9E412]|uniref:zinc metalloprotease HtpX n=1 Tax=Aquibium sp. A9E412 TaxID=2976767 RepID=UPI0025AFB1AC|nr:zinc metalloprotease HtpX [Aquibium sp. A9E412]MDN2565961.1 zinc metalloprotease HtpX [Aquibium sp. A9E412]
MTDRERSLLEQRRHRAINRVHTWLLAGGSLLLLAVTAWAFAGPVGVAAALLVGGFTMWGVGHVSPRIVLNMYKARPVAPTAFPDGVALVAELARRAELPRPPTLYVVPSRMLNAFAVGRREDAALAVTDAMVRALTWRELAGVLAHEISHIAHEDVRVMAFADMVSRYTSIMSTVGILSLFLNLGGYAAGYGAQIPWLAVVVLMAAPTVGALLQLALSRTREYDADLGAVMLTGDPDGLAAALRKLDRAQRRSWETVFLPGGRAPDPSLLRTHPPTEERVRRLMALKGQGGGAQPHGRRAVRPGRSIVPSVPLGGRHGPLSGGPWGLSALGEEATRPACADGLCEPETGPRMRLRRGGVWW